MRKRLLLVTGLLYVLMLTAFAQSIELIGRVQDERGNPVPNASVLERGTNRGTTTDANGNFRMATRRGATLTISSVGFGNKEVIVGNSSDVSITLSAAEGSLSEVVVTGVGVATSKKKLGISVEAISAEKLPPVPNASIDQALVGKVPGALIQSIDGTPGARTQIILRGINTIQGGTKPLILLDGVQINTDINQLDLSSIERVEVVQGAASATLYGAQGANGVIQLFSKKGRRGQVSINASSSYSTDNYLNVGNVHKAMKHSYLTNANGDIVDRSGNLAKLDPYGIYQ
ncbi:MAG: TonB-dependent receptor plug domain-containing protein, partial [Bacteroidota bacterium]|nr:TonB-dependent receptor plug domain-containing protein [Bacteroidota bacterium]